MDTTAKQSKTLTILTGLAALVLTVSLSVAGAALIIRFNDTNVRRDRQTAINVATCHASVSERNGLRAIIIQADKALGTPKSAGFAYYEAHPEELAAAHEENAVILTKYLYKIGCTKLGKLYKIE